jgi:SSS family solute:Na+ symporter
MNIFFIAICIYLIGLTIMNFWKSRQVKNQDDMMLAGRSISTTKMVFTLICTWIGSGTFIAGAEFAAKAGWCALWQAAGVGVGIIIIYFLAAKIRTFGQYTVGDILEARYGLVARLFGAIAIIISFTTIVSYQFKAGGYILKTITDGKISDAQGMFLAFLFVTIFTMIGGMVAIANTDLPNGIIILLSTIISTPLVIMAAGGFAKMKAVLPANHLKLFNPDFTYNPTLKIMAIAISTMLLLLGVQSMYQKFYSARSPREAKRAAGIWVVGTIFIESVAVIMAIFSSVYFWDELQSGVMDHAEVIINAAKRMIPVPVGILLLGAATVVVISTGMNYLLSPTTTIIRDIFQRLFGKKPAGSDRKGPASEAESKPVSSAEDRSVIWLKPQLVAALLLFASFFLPWFSSHSGSFSGFQIRGFLRANPDIGGSSLPGFILMILIYLIPVLCLVIIVQLIGKKSTKFTALLAGIMPFLALLIILFLRREILGQLGIGIYATIVLALTLVIYRDSLKIDPQKKAVFMQKFFIVLLGVVAYFMATRMQSVLENAYFAYTIYGVAVTPALLAALASKKVTKTAGLISIVSATIVTFGLKLSGYVWPSIMRPLGDPNADPFGIPILYPGLAVALLSMVVFSFFTKPPEPEVLARFFPKGKN